MTSSQLIAKLKRKSTLVLAGAGLGIFFITILIIGGAVLLIRGQNPAGTITDSDLRIITAGIKFTDSSSPRFVYQSPVYNFQLTVDTTKYAYYENSSGLSLYAKDSSDSTTFRISADQPYSGQNFDLTTEVQSYKNIITSYASGTIKSESDVQIDGTSAHEIISNREGYGGSTRNTVSVLIVKDNVLYTLEYNHDSDSADATGNEINQFGDEFKFIDSSKVQTSADFVSTLWGYQFTYDTRFWKLDNSNVRSEALSIRDSSLELKDKAEVMFASDEISRFDLLGKESSYLSQAAQDRLGALQQSTSSYPDLKVTNTTDVSLAGRNGKMLEYEISSQYSSQLIKYREYLFLHNNALTRIVINYSDAAGQGFVNAETVVNSLLFTPPSAGQVKGASTSVENEEKVSVQAKPAVARILNITCGDLKVPATTGLTYLSGKTYHLCDGGTGTGFFVNSQGYIGTNGHVVVISDAQMIYDATSGLLAPQLLINYFKDYQTQQKPGQALPSDQEIYKAFAADPANTKAIALGVIKLISKVGATVKSDTQLYVSHGLTVFDPKLQDDGTIVLSNASLQYKATIVDTDYSPEEDTGAGPHSDVALIKLDKTGDYPTLKLATGALPNSGSSVIIIGYPGIATDSGTAGAITSKASQAEATVTRGIVSAVKQDNASHNLIQTDASIDHGNSGGPALNSDVQVIGLATYGQGSTVTAADFNFLRDAADLTALMQKNNITNQAGTTEQKWEEGLNYLWNGQYSKAVTSLEAARTAYPDLIDTDNLITVAKDKIAAGLDTSDKVVGGGLDLSGILGNFSVTEIVLIAIVGAMAMFIVLLILLMLRKRTHVVQRGLPQVQPQTPSPVAPNYAYAGAIPSQPVQPVPVMSQPPMPAAPVMPPVTPPQVTAL